MPDVYRVNQVWQLAAVFEIRRQTKIHGQVTDPRIEFDEEYGAPYHYLLIEENDIPVGTARLNFTHDGFAKIERVSIAQAFQGRGYGRILIHEAESWATDNGYSKVVIHSLDTALGFYQKLGYVQTGQKEIQSDGIAIVPTEKTLAVTEQSDNQVNANL